MHVNRNISEANAESLTPVCTIHVDRVFALLHAKAKAAAETDRVKIENTAADGNDEKNAVFHSAGEHMIVARAKNEDVGKITKDEAFAAIGKYVEVFLGPDVGKGLKRDECFPLDSEELDESALPGFARYFGEQPVLEAEDADDDENAEGAGEKDREEDADEESSGEEAEESGSEEDDGGEGAADSPDEEAASDDADEGGGEGGAEGGGDPKEKEEADGFYMLYGLKIKGMKETTAAEALKKWGSNFLKGFGVRLGSMWGGGSGEVHTIGGLVDGVSKLFGSIRHPEDTDEICSGISDRLKQRFPALNVETVAVRDANTLVRDIEKEKRAGWNGKARQKIQSAPYSIYIHVQDDDIRKPLLNRKEIANIVTMSIKRLFKKFRHMVKADDVVYLRGSELEANKNLGGSEWREHKIPSPSDIQEIISANRARKDKAGNEPDAEERHDASRTIWTKIDNLFTKCRGDKKIKDDVHFKALVKIWDAFYKSNVDDVEHVSISQFNGFLDRYQKEYHQQYDKTNEAEQTVRGLMSSLFENMDVRDFLEMEEAESPGQAAEEDADEGGEESGEQDDGVADEDRYGEGDDLYIIPLPGVKSHSKDDDEWKSDR